MKTPKILAGLATLMAAGITAQSQNFPLCKPKLDGGMMFQGLNHQIPWENSGPAGPQRPQPSSYTFTTVDDPLGDGYGIAFGVEGDLIVGYYVDEVNVSADGYIYNDRNQTWTTVDDPQGAGITIIFNIWQNDIIGVYGDSDGNALSFLYDGRTWTSLQDPLAGPGLSAGTYASGIQGDNIVGYYIDAAGREHGFLYRRHDQSWTTLDAPLAGSDGWGTVCGGINGDNIVGEYQDGNGVNHGFIYDGRSWSTFDAPVAGAIGTGIAGFSGNDLVGVYADSSGVNHGFVDDGRAFTTLDDPQAAMVPGLGTAPSSGDGYSIVGYYFDSTGHTHGFLATPNCGR